MFQVREYDLPDAQLLEKFEDDQRVKVWIPNNTIIILGRSNEAENSLKLTNVTDDNIPVYKRPSGGETVILTPNTIVISIVFRQSAFKGGKSYFNTINNRLKTLLIDYGLTDVNLKGISDITIKDLKILGSALYQNKDIVFYHAVLNVSESTDLIEKYIKHPKREPDYRNGRKHKDFVTSIKATTNGVNIKDLADYLRNGLSL